VYDVCVQIYLCCVQSRVRYRYFWKSQIFYLNFWTLEAFTARFWNACSAKLLCHLCTKWITWVCAVAAMSGHVFLMLVCGEGSPHWLLSNIFYFGSCHLYQLLICSKLNWNICFYKWLFVKWSSGVWILMDFMSAPDIFAGAVAFWGLAQRLPLSNTLTFNSFAFSSPAQRLPLSNALTFNSFAFSSPAQRLPPSNALIFNSFCAIYKETVLMAICP
jgi:hypothetical protein